MLADSHPREARNPESPVTFSEPSIPATNFFFPKGVGNSGNEISTAMCLNQPSVSAGFYFSPRVGSAVGTERNLIHVG